MKQLGNLAIICAQRKDVIMNLENGVVSVSAGNRPDVHSLSVEWDDDVGIANIIRALNFGDMAVCSRG